MVEGAYFSVAVCGPDMYWSNSENVWLRRRCELFAVYIPHSVETSCFGAEAERLLPS